MDLIGCIESMFASRSYRRLYRRERPEEITASDLLMIIDMQPTFLKRTELNDLYSKTHYQLGKVQEAIGNGASILYVEYQDCMPTVPALAIPVANYQKFRRFVKIGDDAFHGTNLEHLIKSYKHGIIHAMGCFAEACVASTLKGGTDKGFAMAVHLPGVISRDSSKIDMMKAIARYNHYNVPIVKRM